MASERPRVTVADVATTKRATVSGPFGSSIAKKFFVADGVPVIRGNNLSLGTSGLRFLDDDFVYLTEKKADELSSAECLPGDLVFTARGTIGQVGLIPQDSKYGRYILSANQLRLRPDPDLADSLYLYYWFSSPRAVNEMQSRNAGSALPNMNLGALRGLTVELRSLGEQRGIARILGALDDKIELNRKMSRTLDEMAQAVFDSLIRQEEGTPARLDGVVSLVRESVAPLDVEPETPYVGLEHFDGGSTFLSRWDSAEKATSGKSRFQSGDILFGKLRPYFHKVVLATFDGICSTDVMVLRPVDDAHRNLALGFVNGDAFIARATAQSEGTRMPRTKWRDVAAYEIVLPSDGLLDTFNTLADPVRHRQAVCVREALTLAEMRDALLPRLLSGDLGISDAEELIQEAV